MVKTSINRLITTEEAADYLGVSKAFLEKDRWGGARIPFVKIGRSVRYRVEDINGYIEAHLCRSTISREDG